MTKLWNKFLAPSSIGGQSLLQKDGPKSDLFNDQEDDDSSSLSEREPRAKRSASKRLFRTRILRSKTVGEEDGYESDASNSSDNSTRSTSSSFLKFQSRSKWRSFLTNKTVVQRKEDGTEIPVKTKSRWKFFSQIYKRQNELNEGQNGGASSDEDDSVEELEPELAPPAPLLEIESSDSLLLLRSPTDTAQESGLSTYGKSEVEKILPSVTTTKTSSFDSSVSNGDDSQTDPNEENKANARAILTKQFIDSTVQSKHYKKKKAKQIVVQQTNDVLTPLSIPRTICYSLRSAIGDGSARQRNSHALMDRRALRPNGSHLDCSHWSHRGKRSYMEDRFVIEHIGKTTELRDNDVPIVWLAVFDGHGGAAASQFCSDWLSSYVRKNEYFPDRIPMAMETAFKRLDCDFVSSGYLDGSTACACAVVGNSKVICCNAGDSRAIIVKRDGTFIPLSYDHKPGRNDETKRINDLGGRVIYWGRWRVEGVLAVSRSIGDAKLKPFVTASPDVIEHDIGEDDMFLVIASDGVWDTMSSDLVAKFVLVNTCKINNKRLQVDDTLFRWISRQISKRARENGSSDNVSCIVANLGSKYG